MVLFVVQDLDRFPAHARDARMLSGPVRYIRNRLCASNPKGNRKFRFIDSFGPWTPMVLYSTGRQQHRKLKKKQGKWAEHVTIQLTKANRVK